MAHGLRRGSSLTLDGQKTTHLYWISRARISSDSRHRGTLAWFSEQARLLRAVRFFHTAAYNPIICVRLERRRAVGTLMARNRAPSSFEAPACCSGGARFNRFVDIIVIGANHWSLPAPPFAGSPSDLGLASVAVGVGLLREAV